MGTQEVVESYYRTFTGFRTMAVQIRSSAQTRLVWFVGIAGFAILNGKALWDALSAGSFSGLPLAFLGAPWVISALLAVVAHFVIDEAAVKDDVYYVTKLAAIDLHLEAIRENKYDPNEGLSIIRDTHQEIVGPKRQSEAWSKAARWLELASFLFLVVGFLWAFIGPFLLYAAPSQP